MFGGQAHTGPELDTMGYRYPTLAPKMREEEPPLSQTLGALLTGLPCRVSVSDTHIPIRAICLDSRQATPGSLFVVLPGQHDHGIRYVADAVARGAGAILLPKTLPKGSSLPGGVATIFVDDPRQVLAEISARLYDFPARHLRLTGITGTNGKTTTVYMLARILEHHGGHVAFWSTNAVHGGGESARPLMTTPDPPDLHHFLRQALEAGAKDVILEVSSHAIVLNRIGGLDFAAGAVTNFSPDHLDFHGSLHHYRQAKASFVERLSPTSTVLLNGDDPVVQSFAQSAKARVRFFGLTRPTDFYAEDIDTDTKSVRFLLQTPHMRNVPVRIPVPGTHNVLNALAAIGIADAYGIAPRAAAGALEHFLPAPRRLQTVNVGPYTIVSDVAMNRASYEAVMTTMASLSRPLVVINAIRGHRGPDVNMDIADALADWNDRLNYAPVILSTSTSQVARLTVDHRVRPEELAAFVTRAHERRLPYLIFPELPDAIRAGVDRLPEGGILLLLGTFGMDEGLSLAETFLTRKISPA